MPSTRRGAGTAFLAVVTVVTLLLAAEAIRRTVAHRYETEDPAVALSWEPTDAAALEARADRLTVAAVAKRSPGATRDAFTAAAGVLIAAPLRWAALRDVGLATDLSGDGPGAAAVMTRAALRGRRDVAVEGWWVQRALMVGDAPAAVRRLDAILRVAPDLEPRLFPTAVALLNSGEATGDWSAATAAEPPWRGQIIGEIAAADPNLDAVVHLFDALQARGSPPTESQYGVILTRLALAGRYAEARAIWTRFAAGTTTTPYDGEFRGRSGPAPFNWRIVQPGDGVVREGPSPSVGTALVAAYPSSANALIAEQLLTLSPGSHRLTGRWRVDQPAAGAAVVWSLTCAGAATPLAAWRRGTDAHADWTTFDLTFVVPAACPGQWLRLSTRAGDGFGEVATAFTGLRIAAETP